jgi:hypothetical protein
MKKLVVMLVIVGIVAVLAAVCATTPKGPADEELISQRIQEGMAAIKAINFDAFNGMVSSSFSSSAVGDKYDLLTYLKNADDAGFLVQACRGRGLITLPAAGTSHSVGQHPC